MSNQSYKIIFSGQVANDTSVESAKQKLKQLLKANDETIERLFYGKKVVLKKDLSREKLDQYLKALQSCGLLVEVDPPVEEALSLDLELIESQTADTSTGNADSSASGNPYNPPLQNTLEMERVHCRNCGAKIDPADKICPYCRARQVVGKPKSKITAGLLAIFLGFLGMHRFYLGQWWGLIYLFFGALSWPVAIIEGIVFLLTPKSRWDEKYSNVSGMGAVGFIVGFFMLIAIVGILAAVAIPAYQDYSTRAAVQAAMPKIDEIREKEEAFILRTNFIPNSNLDASLPKQIQGPNLKSLEIQENGKLVATFFSPKSSLINGETIIWVPKVSKDKITWDCSGGTLATKFRPRQCREGAFAELQSSTQSKLQVTNDGLAELRVPSTWYSMADLAKKGTLGFGNAYSEAYLVIVTDNKSDLKGYKVQDFSQLVLDNNFKPIASKITPLGDDPINQLPAMHYRIEAKVKNIDIVYLIAMVEGQDHFYQVITWSLTSHLDQNLKDMRDTINSFHERTPESI